MLNQMNKPTQDLYNAKGIKYIKQDFKQFKDVKHIKDAKHIKDVKQLNFIKKVKDFKQLKHINVKQVKSITNAKVIQFIIVVKV